MNPSKIPIQDIRAEINKAVLEERERCALIALALIPEGGASIIDERRKHAHDIATEIRRGEMSETIVTYTRKKALEEAAVAAENAAAEWEADSILWHKDGMFQTAAVSLLHSEAAKKVAKYIRDIAA